MIKYIFVFISVIAMDTNLSWSGHRAALMESSDGLSSKPRVILHTTREIGSFNQLNKALSKLDLPSTALALDFDDTVAQRFYTVDDTTFRLASSPDSCRTYWVLFRGVLNELGKENASYKTMLGMTAAWDTLHELGKIETSYRVPERSLYTVLKDNKDSLGYLTILSGLDYTPHKGRLLRKLGIKHYISPSIELNEDKAEAFAKNLPANTRNIVFVDNSLKFAIEPFIKKIEHALDTYFTPEVNEQIIHVYTFHYTRFEKKLQEGENLKNELKQLFEMYDHIQGITQIAA